MVVPICPSATMRAYSTRSAPALQRNADLPDRDGRIDPSNPIHDVTQRPPHRLAFRHAHPLLACRRREAPQRSLTAKPGSPRLADRVRGYVVDYGWVVKFSAMPRASAGSKCRSATPGCLGEILGSETLRLPDQAGISEEWRSNIIPC
jgi:hypothetical protein